MNETIPPSLAGRTPRLTDGNGSRGLTANSVAATSPRHGSAVADCPACRTRRPKRRTTISRSSIKNFLWKVAFSLIVSAIASLITAVGAYIADQIWSLI